MDRNKLLKFVLDNDLVDSKGRWNYRAGYQMMAGGTRATAGGIAGRKQIASATTSDNSAEQKPQSYMTNVDFSKPGARPW